MSSTNSILQYGTLILLPLSSEFDEADCELRELENASAAGDVWTGANLVGAIGLLVGDVFDGPCENFGGGN